MGQVSRATVPTARASGYLQQLCKHFAHKLDTQFTPEAGSIEFDFGCAELRAQDVLLITARANSDVDMDRLKHVLASHLLRFAFRDELSVDWSA